MSRTMIRRRREAGELPGAVLDDDRGWLIPVEDLLAADFRLNAPPHPMRRKSVTWRRPRHSRTRSTRTRCEPSWTGCATSTPWRSPTNAPPVS
ncbi:hypothetical protein JL475_32565 [Streptomyces sp. M2CJ-2]|nr:hypothetical protein [Streptomyces sp. M2CJ-2]MBL3670620.1 hypothetical protein [Streptomyces sp. M2CJ-2]